MAWYTFVLRQFIVIMGLTRQKVKVETRLLHEITVNLGKPQNIVIMLRQAYLNRITFVFIQCNQKFYVVVLLFKRSIRLEKCTLRMPLKKMIYVPQKQHA